MRPMRQSLRSVSICIVALLGSTTNLGAQEEPVRNTPPPRPYVGIVVGLGALPSSLLGHCSDYSADSGGPTPSVLAGFVFGLPLGRLHLETRTHRRVEIISESCPQAQPIFESGIHTTYTPLADNVPKYTSDLRIGYGLPIKLPLVASVGAGWLWGTDIPYLSSGLGFRTTGRVRFTVDLAWEMYRIPFSLSAEEWEDYQLVRVVGEEEKHYWQRGWSFQIGIAGYIR